MRNPYKGQECECFIDEWTDRLVRCARCAWDRRMDEVEQQEVEKEIERIQLEVSAWKEIRKAQEPWRCWNWVALENALEEITKARAVSGGA